MTCGCLLPPLLMMGGAWLGGSVGGLVLGMHSLSISLMAFSIVCLLFLVTQELLVEARETAQEWYVTLWIFLGLLLTYVVDRSIR